MQGNNKTVHEMNAAIKAFNEKITFLHSTISKGDYSCFSNVQHVMGSEHSNIAPQCQQHFCDVLAELGENYRDRFIDLKSQDKMLQLVNNPFLMEN